MEVVGVVPRRGRHGPVCRDARAKATDPAWIAGNGTYAGSWGRFMLDRPIVGAPLRLCTQMGMSGYRPIGL